MLDINNLSLKQLRTALDDKKISAVELAKEYLDRIKALNPELNAFVAVTEDEALKNAGVAQKLIDAGEAKPLTGIPAAIKDNICTDGVKTTCGSKMLEDFTPFYDAEVIGLLKAQNYSLLGKTNLDEFAMGNSNRTSYFGNVKNPHNRERVTGGSSGGSACAVSANLCAYALGTDTGGSIRQPSAMCGVVGLKPTYDRVSRLGVAQLAGSLDAVGPIAKSAEDCAVILNALVNSETNSGEDFTAKIGVQNDLSGLKIALPKELFTSEVNEDVLSAVTATAKRLEKKGAILTEVSIPTLKYSAPTYYAVSTAESVSAMSRYDGIKYGLKGLGYSYDERIRDSRTRGFGDEVKRKLMTGNFMLLEENIKPYYFKALAVRQRLTREYNDVLKECAFILSPTSMRTAFKIDEPFDFVKNYSTFAFTVPANLTGLPCVSVPCGKDKDGLPIGASITGKRLGEGDLLAVANSVQLTVDS